MISWIDCRNRASSKIRVDTCGSCHRLWNTRSWKWRGARRTTSGITSRRRATSAAASRPAAPEETRKEARAPSASCDSSTTTTISSETTATCASISVSCLASHPSTAPTTVELPQSTAPPASAAAAHRVSRVSTLYRRCTTRFRACSGSKDANPVLLPPPPSPERRTNSSSSSSPLKASRRNVEASDDFTHHYIESTTRFKSFQFHRHDNVRSMPFKSSANSELMIFEFEIDIYVCLCYENKTIGCWISVENVENATKVERVAHSVCPLPTLLSFLSQDVIRINNQDSI